MKNEKLCLMFYSDCKFNLIESRLYRISQCKWWQWESATYTEIWFHKLNAYIIQACTITAQISLCIIWFHFYLAKGNSVIDSGRKHTETNIMGLIAFFLDVGKRENLHDLHL